MASNTIPTLKFVGTVSLGLLTGLSYTLTTLTVPLLLSLPSANTAAHAIKTLSTSAEKRLRSLASLSGSTFLLAYLLSPRIARHPYLLYTSVLVLASQFATSSFVAPYLYLSPRQPQTSRTPSAAAVAAAKQRQERAAASHAHMEASYEVLGASVSDAHSEGNTSSEEIEVEEQNGEVVRAEVESFLKKQLVQGSLTALAFVLSVVGIWGDGANGVAVVVKV